MKSNLKFVLGITMVMLLLLVNIGEVYAADIPGIDAKSLLEKGFGAVTGSLDKLVGGPFWLHGLVAGAASAFKTYTTLDETINMTVRADRVNISDYSGDYVSEDAEDTLKIDFDKNTVLTDQNVLDIDFITTRKAIDYKDPIGQEKSPSMRWAEKTEVINVIDTNNTKAEGQKRAILFEDGNLTIKDAYEYRTLVIEYTEAQFQKQPVSVKINSINDLYGSNFGNWLRVFASGVNQAKERLLQKIDKLGVFKNRNPQPSPNKVQKFHLLFNSRVDDNETISQELLDCTNEAGLQIGTTGTEVLPKVMYDWRFANSTPDAVAINGIKLDSLNWCDTATNGVYCDSTQFTIEALQKIDEINDFVSTNNSDFNCSEGAETQNLISDVNNTGITYLNAPSVTEKKATIEYKIRGNYQLSSEFANRTLFDINYTVEKKSENSLTWVTISSGKIKSVPASYITSGGSALETFNTPNFTGDPLLPTDTIKITVFLTNFSSLVSDNETGNNLIDNTLDLQTNLDGSTTGCNLEKTTENLKKYNKEFKEELYNFKVYLMKDGYSDDFKKDFDDYYRFTFNSTTPGWYGAADPQTEKSAYAPLYKYFTSPDKFKFTIRNAGTEINKTLPGPGRYDVKIMVYYDNSWELFNDAGDVTGRIEIIMEKEQNPELDSAIYYMPLDGMVGSSDKTRNGYGVDYLNDKIPILLTAENNYETAMYTEGYLSSSTISTVNTEEITDFANMNNGDERGKLLSITRSSDRVLDVRYLPSRPTPVVLKVNNTAVNTDAYAFYKLSIGLPIEEGGEVANPGLSLVNWTGFAQCKDFTGVDLLERFLANPDLVSVNSQISPITQSQSHSYGVEWTKDTITRTGNVWLYGIFYTPANFRTGSGISHLYIDSQNDYANLYKCDNEYAITADTSTGCKLVAGGSNSNASFANVPLKNIYAEDIKSMNHIFNLVKEKKACVNYSGQMLEVFYNPKAISQPLTNAVDAKITDSTQPSDEFSCIKN